MSIDLKKYKKDLLFLPLGGSGEIGMNFNLYQFDGKWLIVDCGAGFADDHFPGIDLMVPDISFLEDKVKDILGIVLTHAHEDHLGAIQHLWHKLRLPVYTTPFTASFLKSRLKESDFKNDVIIKELAENSKFKLGPFEIQMQPITHSAPEMQALLIKTKVGNIFHTGDWKFDDDPLISLPNNYEKLKNIGKEGILAVVSDSTNVFNKEPSGSEGALRNSLVEIIKGCKNTIVVTTFASNVARLETLFFAAKQAKRKVALAGKSLWRIVDSATESGYLVNIPDLVDLNNISKIPRDELMVIATGCQGEPMAATTKMANDAHPHLKLNRNDTVIFSSKIIPGNEKKIYRLFNLLANLGVNVITEKDHFVHVSGHPSSIELKRMYEMINPQIVVPVHGEIIHMREHARLAKDWGYKSLNVSNGMLAKLNNVPEEISFVNSGYICVNGKKLIDSKSKTLRIRRKLQTSGVIIVSILCNDKGRMIADPILSTPGVLNDEDDSEIIETILDEIYDTLHSHGNSISKKHKITSEIIINLTRQSIRRIIRREVGTNPIIEVNVRYL